MWKLEGMDRGLSKQEKALVEMDRLLDGLARVMEPKEIGAG
jgi:hypothetical protein